jgi:uncharacterized protein YcsI (UPF0317 family)
LEFIDIKIHFIRKIFLRQEDILFAMTKIRLVSVLVIALLTASLFIGCIGEEQAKEIKGKEEAKPLSEASKIRQMIRRGEWNKPTTGLRFEQANLVILPKYYAYDFLLFCQRNPKPCPLIEVGDVGNYQAKCAPGSDIRFDIPKYRVYKKGKLIEECKDIEKYWRDDLVFFLLGCSFTFESALVDNGISLKHLEQGKNVAMYNTNIQCNPAGIFEGNMVVSMRPIKLKDLVKAIEITSKFEKAHGAPIHIGNPREIGIKSLNRPDYGDPIDIDKGEIPVFWACGVTPQLIALEKKIDLMITHSPGYMLILG